MKTLEHQCLGNIEPCSRAGDLNTACSYVDDVEETGSVVHETC